MTRHKPIVLAFNKFYLPGYRAGGPIRTLANMVDRLGHEFDFHIVTQDHDAGDTGVYSDVVHGEWSRLGMAKVMYLSRESVSIRKLKEITRRASPDVLYLNSFFDPIFTQKILVARRFGALGKLPVVLAPRGEFSKGALGLKSIKKRLYLRAASMVGLYRDVIWQASSLGERLDLLNSLRFVRPSDVVEAMNLAPTGDDSVVNLSARDPNEPLRVCFLSRISPMKNLNYALQVLARVKSEVLFTIYGPKEIPSYWAECEGLIAALPSNVQVNYAGEVTPAQVKSLLAQHDMFFFPTRGENYGHVIHEALGSGLPVLISDRTPWGGVVERDCGWEFSLDDPDQFARCVDDYAAWSADHVLATKQKALKYARERAVDLGVLEANRELFHRAMRGGWS